MDVLAGILIAAGLAVILADLHLTQLGVPGGIGILSIAAGLVILMASSWPAWLVSILSVAIVAAAVVSAAGLVVSIRKAARAIPADPVCGQEGIVRHGLTPEGQVLVGGVLWAAASPAGFVPEGAKVLVTGRRGLRLTVAPLAEGAPGRRDAVHT